MDIDRFMRYSREHVAHKGRLGLKYSNYIDVNPNTFQKIIQKIWETDCIKLEPYEEDGRTIVEWNGVKYARS